jgi:hypothetical protein
LARVADLIIRPRLFSGNQEGVLGGEDLPVPRLGDRFAVDVATSQLRQDAQSRQLIAALMEATTADARIRLRMPNAPTVVVGNGMIDGSGQTGSALAVRGMIPNGALSWGMFFSIVHAGVHRVHMVRSQVIADGAGRALVPIWPMLRFISSDGDVCHFVDPQIEGQLIGFDKGAGFERNRTKPLAFTIQERK